jgi:hypothetical protein
MKRWEVVVAEIRAVAVTYTVEADTLEEAVEMAENGETVDETDAREIGVERREILDGPTEIEEEVPA